MAAPAHEPRLARVAAMIADPARSRMLAYLLSGAYASAGELARAASVAPPTASGHLGKLQASGFVVCEARGRHRYYRLADAEIAHALEALSLVAERNTHDKAWASPERQRLRYARCCYGHMAGTLGVALFDCLHAANGLLATAVGFELTPGGHDKLAAIGFAPQPPQTSRRFAYGCLDWSERRDHLAGALASDLLEHVVQQGWLRTREAPGPRTGAPAGGNRVLTLTPSGRQRLLPWLGTAPPEP